MAINCRPHFEDQDFDMDRILERVVVSSPQTYDEIFGVLNNFDQITKNRQIRLIILNSIAFLRYSSETPLERTQTCFKILDKLYKLSTSYNLAVVIINELVTRITMNGEVDLHPAGGSFCAHRIHTRLMLTRLDDNQFAAHAMKSSTLPKVSSKFQVTADGIRDIVNRV